MKQLEHPLSWSALFRIVITILAVYLLLKSLSVLVAILIAVMLATALFPLYKRLDTILPSFLSAFLVVLLLLVPFIILGSTIIPSLGKELPALIKTVDRLLSTAPFLPESIRSTDLTSYIQGGASYILRSTNVLANIATTVITVFFLTFYFLFDAPRLLKLALSLFSTQRRKNVASLLSELGRINGQYIRGNLLISGICSIIIFTGLTLLQIPFAAPLAILAGLLDLLPLIGPTIAMIPAVIIAFSISPLTGFLVLILFLIYQQTENSVIAPAIYNKALSLSPALSFLSVIIGSSLFGIVGAFLALPIAASLPVLIRYLRDNHLSEENRKNTPKRPRYNT